MKRTNTVKLVVDRETHEELKKLGTVTAKCWNEVNWLRMQQFKRGERVDFAKTEKEVYEKYKNVLKVNASQVARKNAEAWRSFFSLMKDKKEGKLPKWFKPRPPGYWKYRNGTYRLIILIRNDRYEVDEGRQIIYLKDFKLALRFRGKLKWHGKQDRLEIVYNEARTRWYAHIPVEVEEDVGKAQNSLRASVDLGIVNLATVYVEDGSWLLFKGGSVLSQYEYYGKQISRIQKLLARHRQRTSRRLKLLYDKRRRFLKHALNSMVRKIMTELKKRGVGELIIGYPKEIARKRGNKLTVNFWSYGYIVRRFEEVGEELGIKTVEVNEADTSKTCSLCGEAHKNGRVKRGSYRCPRTGKVINADLNGAINILHIPESQRATDGGLSVVRDRGNGLKTQPVVYRWTNGAGWVETPTSNEVMRMKTVNHKPMIRPKGNPRSFRAGRRSKLD
ncbi:transposase [Thermofilum sp.]|jgi:putative transposase|uniref:RNA-guided endonuclease InsQ/TnpB family protein n=2 Tax=Thermofilum sp. TaxID=1961369 RepID=UPI00258E0D65|nr:transposase [Thermofilum sp.]